MSFVMKVVAILAIVLALQLTESEARKHITHKSPHFTYGGADAVMMPRKHNFHGEADENRVDTVVHGKIVCEGQGKEGIRPLLQSPEYPRSILNIVSTNSQGWYRLTTGTSLEFHTHIYMTIRHQCKIVGVVPQERCAVPYYTTQIPLNVINVTYIPKDIELSEMRDFSTPDCLY